MCAWIYIYIYIYIYIHAYSIHTLMQRRSRVHNEMAHHTACYNLALFCCGTTR